MICCSYKNIQYNVLPKYVVSINKTIFGFFLVVSIWSISTSRGLKLLLRGRWSSSSYSEKEIWFLGQRLQSCSKTKTKNYLLNKVFNLALKHKRRFLDQSVPSFKIIVKQCFVVSRPPIEKCGSIISKVKLLEASPLLSGCFQGQRTSSTWIKAPEKIYNVFDWTFFEKDWIKHLKSQLNYDICW